MLVLGVGLAGCLLFCEGGIDVLLIMGVKPSLCESVVACNFMFRVQERLQIRYFNTFSIYITSGVASSHSLLCNKDLFRTLTAFHDIQSGTLLCAWRSSEIVMGAVQYINLPEIYPHFVSKHSPKSSHGCVLGLGSPPVGGGL